MSSALHRRTRRTSRAVDVVWLLVAVLVNPVGAQAPSPLPARVGIAGETAVSLEDAIAQALANNTDIAVARVAAEQAGFDVEAAYGGLDPTVGLETSFLRQVMPVASLIGGSASGSLTQQAFRFGPQVSGRVPAFGTQYALSLSTERQTSDNQFTTLNPQFPTALSLNVTQPLFRGRRFDEPRWRIEVARQNDALSESALRQRVMDIVLLTGQAYWDLVLAGQTLQVQVQGLDLAQQQVASSRRLADQGSGAPIDIVEAETQAATVEQSVYLAQAALTRAENALKILILSDRSSPLWSHALRATTPVRLELPSESLEDAVRQALANRPELAQAGIAAAANEINTRFFRDQARPRIDLVGSYTSAGLAGRVVPSGPNPLTGGLDDLVDRLNVLSEAQGLDPLPSLSGGGSSVPPALIGGYGQSLSTLLGQDFPTVQVGLQISLPFRNRAAEADLASALAEGRRVQLERQRLEEAIEADVRNALQAVQSGRARLTSAGEARGFAEEQYASEQRRFQAGTSTLFLVVQRQTALISARTRYAQAETDLSKAIVVLQRTTGQILTAYQITLE